MTDQFAYSKGCPVYPGEYIPMPETEALLASFKKHAMFPIANPPVNMDEFKDCFKLEIIVPGIRRQDIFVHTEGNILSIIVVQKKDVEVQIKENHPIHEFDSTSFERHIILPENADAGFISATYIQGILRLYIPKTNIPSRIASGQVVVY